MLKLCFVLNTSGLTIIPISIFALRSGADSPTEVFLPILISTFIASLAGLLFVAFRQRINLLNGVVLSYIGGLTLLIGLMLFYVVRHPSQGEAVSGCGWRNYVRYYFCFYLVSD